jgi:hypothetical protein
VVGRAQRFPELPAAVGGALIWAAITVSGGPGVGLKFAWMLAMALVLGAWVVRMRLLVQGSVMTFAIVGPWRHRVDLSELQSVAWKHTGGPGSRGVFVVRDDQGRHLQIPVGRLSGIEVWGKLLLDAAARSGATIDISTRHSLGDRHP